MIKVIIEIIVEIEIIALQNSNAEDSNLLKMYGYT